MRLVDPLGMLDGELLADHAAHGKADDMRAALAEVVEQGDHVVGHVGERIGRRERRRVVTGREQRFHGWWRFDRSVRKANIAVVEHDRAKACIDDAVDQRIRPLHELASQAVHEQHARVGTGATVFEVDFAAASLEYRHGKVLSPLPAREQRSEILAKCPGATDVLSVWC